MPSNTKPKKKTARTKPRSRKSPQTGKARRTKAASVIRIQSIAGLKGKGLLSLGDKSKLELRDWLGMARPMFARVVDVSPRTIADAESGKTAQKLVRNYNEVHRLCEALSDVVDRESLGLWFQTPNDAFGGLKPIEVIERGEIDRLWNMLYQLQSGMPG